MSHFTRQPQEGLDLMGQTMQDISEISMADDLEGRLPSDLRSLPSGDLVKQSLNIAESGLDYEMDMEIEIAPAPQPMPSYGKHITFFKLMAACFTGDFDEVKTVSIYSRKSALGDSSACVSHAKCCSADYLI